MTPEEIKRLRKWLYLSQMELALLAGVSQTTICNIDNGKRKTRKKTLQKVITALKAAQKAVPVHSLPTNGPTNGDAIRRMSDEELVFIITCQTQTCRIPPPDRDCYQCKLSYLGREAKGEEA